MYKIKESFICHLFLGYIFIASGLIISFIMLCSAIIWPFSKTLYRRVNCALAYCHWSQLVFLARRWSNSKATVHASLEDQKYFGKESAIVILNHKYEIDWLMGWMIAESYNFLGSSKVFVKSSLKYAPFIGWMWIATETVFLRRNWAKDRITIVRDIRNLMDYPLDFWLLLFPEGTRFTEAKHKISLEFAEKQGLKPLKHHLLPRTKGFALVRQALEGHDKVRAVYDVTACTLSTHPTLIKTVGGGNGIVGHAFTSCLHYVLFIVAAVYDCCIGFKASEETPSIMSVAKGTRFNLNFYCRRIPISDIPLDEDKCTEWMYDLYQEKDKMMDRFLKHGDFPFPVVPNPPDRYFDAVNFAFWSILLSIPLCYAISNVVFYASMTMRIVAALVTVILSIGIRLLIALTEVKSGSSYGKHSPVSGRKSDSNNSTFANQNKQYADETSHAEHTNSVGVNSS